MARISTENPVESIRGKLGGTSSGYFYMRNGKQFYHTWGELPASRTNPSSEMELSAFACAHKQLRAVESDALQTAQMNADYDTAKHLAPNGKSYPTAHAWKFNCLIHEYKQANPMEQGK